MSTWATIWMILHVLGAVVAFGPMYTQPMITAWGRKNPQQAALAAEISAGIASRFTIPFGLTVPITGYALIVTGDIGFFDNTWLWLSVVLYAIALAFALVVQRPNVLRMLGFLRSRPSGPPQPGQGPPPQISALGQKLKLGMTFLILLMTVVFVLMIWQPGAAVHA